jgi:hypothetical protein
VNPFFSRNLVRLLLDAHREARERGTRLVMNVERVVALGQRRRTARFRALAGMPVSIEP